MDIFTPEEDEDIGHADHAALPNGVLTGNSSIASVAIDSNHHIRVYFQDSEGYLRQSECRDGTWTGGTRINTEFHAKPNTTLAATIYIRPRSNGNEKYVGSNIYIYFFSCSLDI